MSVYTVHEPPGRGAGSVPAAERIIFVRDGFSFWAFLFAPLWMLWHRMWLVLIAYAAVVAAIEASMVRVGASRTVIAVISLFISVLVGLEASTLCRVALRRRGWHNVGIVSGDDVEDAERRFFAVWLQRGQSQSAARPAASPSQHSVPLTARAARPSEIIGLFPESGSRR